MYKINEEVVYEQPAESIKASMRAAAITKYTMKYTTVFIGPTRIAEEDRCRSACPCPNTTNPWHACGKWCCENMGCNRQCIKKKGKHKRRKVEPTPQVLQAIYGLLKGPIQTTPRAELESIAIVLEHALPPICIVTDHKNYVNAFHCGRRQCCRS